VYKEIELQVGSFSSLLMASIDKKEVSTWTFSMEWIKLNCLKVSMSSINLEIS
jgi:hypothetical protein